MQNIRVRNVNEAFVKGVRHLLNTGIVEESRNGRVLVAPEPVVTTYLCPDECVLFAPERDANPFFHFTEAMWMLAGKNDVAFPAHFAKQIAEYSDDGVTLYGAYGYRWRNWFGYDQIKEIVKEFKRNPKTRRAVLAMWDGGQRSDVHSDLQQAIAGGKDVPCNSHVYFDTVGDRLNMTVCCRSNDSVWGAYGANAVHFSYLLQYVASATNLPLGTYRQFSNNFHAYIDRPDFDRVTAYVQNWDHKDESPRHYHDKYWQGKVASYPLDVNDQWLEDLEHMVADWEPGAIWLPDELGSGYHNYVTRPIMNAHANYKNGNYEWAFSALEECRATDWKFACEQWLLRRQRAALAKVKQV